MTREPDSEARLFSAGLALACHVGLAWWLLHPAPPAPAAAPQAPVLQVTWIERTSPERALAVRPPQRPPAAPAGGGLQIVPVPGPGDRYDGDPGFRDPAGPRPPDTATLLQQGLEWARGQAGPTDFAPDPLRGPRREPRAAERFAMRDPTAPADVARAIGTLMGGPGYESSPCPRIRRNLAALGPAGDNELMREEIRRLQSLCM